jgi:hypothetical protein
MPSASEALPVSPPQAPVAPLSDLSPATGFGFAANSQATAVPVTGPNLAGSPQPLSPVALARAARPVPHPLDPIETWLFDGHLNAESIVAALQGQSTLKSVLGHEVQDDDKRRLVDRALAYFSELAFDKIDELASLVRNPNIDPRVRRLVAERLLQRAVHPGDAAENPRAQARAFALYFVRAMGERSRGMADLLAPPNLSPEDGFSLARALSKEPLPDTHLMTSHGRLEDPRLNEAGLLSSVRDQILAAVPLLAGTPAARR